MIGVFARPVGEVGHRVELLLLTLARDLDDGRDELRHVPQTQQGGPERLEEIQYQSLDVRAIVILQ